MVRIFLIARTNDPSIAPLVVNLLIIGKEGKVGKANYWHLPSFPALLIISTVQFCFTLKLSFPSGIKILQFRMKVLIFWQEHSLPN